jgi:hypothetical protein
MEFEYRRGGTLTHFAAKDRNRPLIDLVAQPMTPALQTPPILDNSPLKTHQPHHQESFI